ncbi:hypothetical protein TPHA_0P00300 [Tetrapisispora phaffii CBS 4417]|uniref:Efficient mitochondria targeting-associated protein 19 n=1 Tax=Tetrapisispora phaffii (strain ATCC 24235 / CBS 4417 / NBRC 1672 / NRRL Y-8282 / UCD 70-5) TaxID=1071381 RepID=G8C210_TETPH|nr:hypothetical protein TPHA_0P00300 [Tetrapisispora phaffii CBS 4417]CCE66188.1 hypothetical protein TPHA_0P00300 [Tetrapisispora phaffii CBS 4417]
MLTPLELSFYTYYSLLHIPITLCIDSTVVLPWRWFPRWVQAAVRWHVAQNHDYLLDDPPWWLVLFVAVELLVQLPLFCYFAWQLPRLRRPASVAAGDDKLLKGARRRQHRRVLALLRGYGANASLTTLVCIVHICRWGHVVGGAGALSPAQKLQLVAVYLPTFVIPLRLCFV